MHSRILKKITFITSIFALLVTPSVASASAIVFGSHGQEIGLNQKVEIGVFVDSESENINAVEGVIYFPQQKWKLDEIRDGQSTVLFWVEKPHALTCEKDECAVKFSGIIPGGFLGPRGYLFSIIGEAQQVGDLTISSRDERILLNDGEGTATKVHSAPIHLVMKEKADTKGEFLPPYDNEPPELFTPQIAQDPNIFENKWFLVFATQDKSSGIDRYEVKEKRFFDTEWITAESPYLLSDQDLQSDIYVKAVDKAKNERIVILSAPNALPWYDKYATLIITIAGVCLLLILLLFVRRKRSHG